MPLIEDFYRDNGEPLPAIQKVIDNALARTKKRVFIGNEPVFMLCVGLQKILRANVEAEALIPVVQEFYEQADGRLLDENSNPLSWEDILEQFLDAWRKVKYADITHRAIEAAKADPKPRPELAHLDATRQFLGKVLYHRQRLEGSMKAFPFSSYDVPGFSSDRTALRVLKRFCRDSILEFVEKGDPVRRIANKYRYIGDRTHKEKRG